MLDLSFKQLIIAGGPIFFILVGLSIYSVAIIWERWKKYKATFSGMKDFIRKTHSLVKAGNIKRVGEISSKQKKRLSGR